MNAAPWWLNLMGSGIVLWLLNKAWSIWANRRKLPTSAVTVLQNASVSQIELTQQDNARLRKENEESRARERATDHRNDVLLDALREQVAYTKRQTQVIRLLGGQIEDPPPLPAELLAP